MCYHLAVFAMWCNVITGSAVIVIWCTVTIIADWAVTALYVPLALHGLDVTMVCNVMTGYNLSCIIVMYSINIHVYCNYN